MVYFIQWYFTTINYEGKSGQIFAKKIKKSNE